MGLRICGYGGHSRKKSVLKFSIQYPSIETVALDLTFDNSISDNHLDGNEY